MHLREECDFECVLPPPLLRCCQQLRPLEQQCLHCSTCFHGRLCGSRSSCVKATGGIHGRCARGKACNFAVKDGLGLLFHDRPYGGAVAPSHHTAPALNQETPAANRGCWAAGCTAILALPLLDKLLFSLLLRGRSCCRLDYLAAQDLVNLGVELQKSS